MSDIISRTYDLIKANAERNARDGDPLEDLMVELLGEVTPSDPVDPVAPKSEDAPKVAPTAKTLTSNQVAFLQTALEVAPTFSRLQLREIRRLAKSHGMRPTQGFYLLTPGNPKTAKGQGLGYLTFILHLMPSDLSGYQVCPKAGECKRLCLAFAGRGGLMRGVAQLTFEHVKAGRMNQVTACRIRRTRLYFEARPLFLAILMVDILRALKVAYDHGLIPVIRPNGTSDIMWERVRVSGKRTMFDLFPRTQFYDYTKLTNRRDLPANYHLTFSLAENNEPDAVDMLERGMNVATVFRSAQRVGRAIAEGFLGRTVINGDSHDLRFIDPVGGNIVALYAKGRRARQDQSGFVRD
jgi:hypothetical protein